MAEIQKPIESTGDFARFDKKKPLEEKTEVKSKTTKDTASLKKELLGESFVRSRTEEIRALKESDGYKALEQNIQTIINTALTNPNIPNTRAVQNLFVSNGLEKFTGSKKAGEYDGLF
jgi:hypothetical protein